MRSVDLAVYADVLAAEAAALAARLERARGRLRQAAIEHEARRALPPEIVARLEGLGLLGPTPERLGTAELADTQAALAAVERLQAWVEAQLHAERERGAPGGLPGLVPAEGDYAAGAGTRSLSSASRAAR